MKVLKFSGASVGSTKNLQQVKRIVESTSEPVIIVASAVGGITDKLINTTKLAAQGSLSYQDEFKAIVNIHNDLIEAIIPTSLQEATLKEVGELHNELENILKGVFLIKDLTKKIESAILSYGERISSLFISKFIYAKLYDSRKFLKTDITEDGVVVNFDETYKLIKETFCVITGRVIVPGFIATASGSDEITILGRGGSDYTAALIASALSAKGVEIWGGSDGFMTADPAVISKA